MHKREDVSPERAELAEAIAAAATMEAEHAALSKALATAERQVSEARNRVVVANAALDEAPAAMVRHLTEAAGGGVATAPKSVKDARRELADQEDQLQMCKLARDGLQARFDGFDGGFSANRVRNAALAVLRAEAGEAARTLAADVIRLQRQLAAKGAALEWLERNKVLPTIEEPGFQFGRAADEDIRTAVFRLGTAPNRWPPPAMADGPGAEAWNAMLSALIADAAAPLNLED